MSATLSCLYEAFQEPAVSTNPPGKGSSCGRTRFVFIAKSMRLHTSGAKAAILCSHRRLTACEPLLCMCSCLQDTLLAARDMDISVAGTRGSRVPLLLCGSAQGSLVELCFARHSSAFSCSLLLLISGTCTPGGPIYEESNVSFPEHKSLHVRNFFVSLQCNR